MKDKDKTKEQLIAEVERLKSRFGSLEKELNEAETKYRFLYDGQRESEGKYRTVFENTGMATIIEEEDTTISLVNEEFVNLSGYCREELEGKKRWTEFVVKEDLARIMQYHKSRRTDAGSAPRHYECRFIDREGNTKDIFLTVAMIPGTGKSVASLLDITERKQAEEKIQHLNLVLRAIRNVNQFITKEKDRGKLLEGSCKNLTESRGYYSAWIALLDESGKLTAHAESGLGKDFLPMVECLKQGRLPACGQTALKQPEVVVTEDPASTCTDCPLSSRNADRGGMTVRLEHGGKVYGLLSVSVPLELAKDAEELGLFHEVAGDIAFALCNIELEEKRKQVEEEIRNLVKFPSENPNPVFRVSKDGAILYANRPGLPLLAALGCSAGQSAPEYWHKLILDTLDSGSSEATEIECQERIFSLLFAPVTEAGYVNIYGQDITERKKTEELLRESEERFRTIFNTANDGILLADLANQKFYMGNTVICQMLGYSLEEIKNLGVTDIHPKEDLPYVLEQFDRQAKGDITLTTDIPVKRKDGSVFYADVNSGPITLAGRPYLVGIFRDITERKQAEAEKQEMWRKAQVTDRLASVGEMASGIAHEINNPLTGVVGFSEMLMEKDLPEDIRKDVEIIHDGSKRVAGIVKRLLAFARQRKPERTYTDINEIIEGTLVLRKYSLETGNIEVSTSLDAELPWTMADRGQLQQVFMNIIVNAETEMKQAHGRGKLTIKTEQTGNTIRISFADDGPGIARENIGKVFDPFFTTREVGEGTGLGLSLSYGIIAEHKGTLYVKSWLGKGATFFIELPIIAEERQLGLAEPAGEVKGVSGARILVVDDEPTILTFLKRVLGGEGYDVETVSSGKEALKMIKNKRYGLILCDIKLPGLSGAEIYEQIEKVAPSLQKRVMFITGDVISADTEEFLKRIKAPYINKPFDIAGLKREVRCILSENS